MSHAPSHNPLTLFTQVVDNYNDDFTSDFTSDSGRLQDAANAKEDAGASAFARATWAMYERMDPAQQASFQRRFLSALYSESSSDEDDEEGGGRYGRFTSDEYDSIMQRLPPG